MPLAGPANKQGRLIADHINGKKIVNNGYIASSIIQVFNYTGASTSLNEAWIKFHKLNIEYDYTYVVPVDRVGIMPGVKPIFIKIIFEKNTGKLLGAQAIGQGIVDKKMDVLSTAIKSGMTVEELQDLELCYAPPYSTGKDTVNHAGYVASNILNDDFKQVPFTKVKDLIEGNAQIIDVRNPEIANGMLNFSRYFSTKMPKFSSFYISNSKSISQLSNNCFYKPSCQHKHFDKTFIPVIFHIRS